MRHLIQALPVPKDERLIAGFEHNEDAAVYRLDDERALIFTVDVITPLVDDPALYGAIAATNSISDVAAVGGQPRMALSFFGIPEGFPVEVAAEIGRGAAEAAMRQGAPVVGGHTVESRDLMYGLAVVGEAHPARLFLNHRLRPGDQLVLTKPLGTGALTTALRAGKLEETDLAEAFAGMTQPNTTAVPLLHAAGVCAATDVTGFGLLGHAAGMASASGVQVVIEQQQVPEYARSREMLDRKQRTRGHGANLEYARSLGPLVGEPEALLRDAQTSGGLFVAVHPEKVSELLRSLHQAGYARAARVGEVRAGAGLHIVE